MLTPEEAHGLQDLLQFLVFYIDMLEYEDPPPDETGSSTPMKYNKEKRKEMAKAALFQLSGKISSLTRRDVPWPGETG